MHGIILRNSMTVLLFVGLSLSPVPVRKQKHLYQLVAFAFFFCRRWRLFSSLLSLIYFFFTRTGYSLDDISDISSSRDLSKALSLATMFTITGITSIVLKFLFMFKELPLKGLPKNPKGQWWQKRIYSCPLKWMFDANLCILSTAFLQKLYCARVSHGIVLKMADLSILMEPTLLLKKGSATVSYNKA